MVIGGLAGFLFVVDEVINGYGAVDEPIVPFAVLIGGVWGGVGGFASGCVCAVVTWFLRRRGTCTELQYGRVGAVVTLGLALPLSVLVLAGGGAPTAWDVAAWVLIPVGVSTAAAAVVGRWIWRRTVPVS